MGCGCKNGENGLDGEIKQDENFNVLGNTVVRILLMLIIVLISPLIIPVMWYMSYIQIFKNGKEIDLYPGIKALVNRLLNKKNDKDDDDLDIKGININELELVSQVDEVDKETGK